MRASVQAACPAWLLTFVCLVPFLNKAFTIDDPTFLIQAGWILEDPLRPLHGAGAGGILMGYAMVPTVWAGAREWVGHLTQLLLSFWAVYGMAGLALRLGWDVERARLAALVFAATPPLLIMANTVMPDVLAVAFVLAGVCALLDWKRERRWTSGVAAGVFLGLAPFARPHTFLLIPLGTVLLLEGLALSAIAKEMRADLRKWWPLLLALVVTIVVTIWIRTDSSYAWLPGANIPLFLLTWDNARRNLFSYLIYWAFPIPLAIPWVLRHWRKAPSLLVGFPLLSAGEWWLAKGDTAAPLSLLATAASGAVLLHLVWTQIRRLDTLGLFLAGWLILPLAPLPYAHLPIKYHLAALPAVMILLLRLSDGLSSRQVRAWALAFTAIGAVHSLLVLRADYYMADQARIAAERMVKRRVLAGERVFSNGGWGFRWYPMQAGSMPWHPKLPLPQPGDLVAIAPTEGSDRIQDYVKSKLVDVHSASCNRCGLTMTGGASLYNNIHGNIIWTIGDGEVARFELWRVLGGPP